MHEACPAATLAALLIAQERELLLLHFDVSQTNIKIRKANQWDLDYQKYVRRLAANGMTTFPGWPLEHIKRRAQRYHDLLWDNVFEGHIIAPVLYHDSLKKTEAFVTDEEYIHSLRQVVAILGALEVSWTPIRGTLLTLTRFGHRSLPTEPSDPRRHKHLFEDDIDIVIHFSTNQAATEGIITISEEFGKNGWKCFGKSSLDRDSYLNDFKDIRPIDILYCVKLMPSGQRIVLDITAVTFDMEDENEQIMAYVFRYCIDGTCTIPPDVGSLKHNGGTVPWNAIRPTRACRAFVIEIPCPADLDLTLRAMMPFNGTDDCFAYPLDKKLEQWDEFDLEMAHGIAQDLDAQGYLSVKSMFKTEACMRKKSEILARIAKNSAPRRNNTEEGNP